jgi:hydroxyacylglutathione hydrolase
VKGAVQAPLASLAEKLGTLDRDTEYAVVCAGGYRSTIATSLLARAGFRRVVATSGGMDAYRKAGLPVEELAG